MRHGTNSLVQLPKRTTMRGIWMFKHRRKNRLDFQELCGFQSTRVTWFKADAASFSIFEKHGVFTLALNHFLQSYLSQVPAIPESPRLPKATCSSPLCRSFKASWVEATIQLFSMLGSRRFSWWGAYTNSMWDAKLEPSERNATDLDKDIPKSCECLFEENVCMRLCDTSVHWMFIANELFKAPLSFVTIAA